MATILSRPPCINGCFQSSQVMNPASLYFVYSFGCVVLWAVSCSFDTHQLSPYGYKINYRLILIQFKQTHIFTLLFSRDPQLPYPKAMSPWTRVNIPLSKVYVSIQLVYLNCSHFWRNCNKFLLMGTWNEIGWNVSYVVGLNRRPMSLNIHVFKKMFSVCCVELYVYT